MYRFTEECDWPGAKEDGFSQAEMAGKNIPWRGDRTLPRRVCPKSDRTVDNAVCTWVPALQFTNILINTTVLLTPKELKIPILSYLSSS